MSRGVAHAASRAAGVGSPMVGALVLSLVGLVVAAHVLFVQGLLPHSYDLDSFYAPSWAFFAQNLKAGAFPEWNPYVFGGAAYTGDPQSQALYPPTLLLFSWLSLPTATLCWFGFHYLLAGAGTFRLARNLTLAPTACAIAAIAYAGSTYLVARAQAPTLLAGAAWMPVILAAAVSSRFRDPNRRASIVNVPLAVTFTLQALSGSQQVCLLTAVACVAVTLVDAERRHVVATSVSLVLGALMAAPQLIPLAYLVRDSTAASGIDRGGFGALSWGDRAILAGSFSRTASETAPIYLGALGAGQALVAIVAERAHKAVRVILVLAALSLVWALGLVGDLVAPLIPSLATITSHQPVRALPLAVLAFALAVGLYWERIRSATVALAAVGVSVASFLVAGTLGPVAAPLLGGVAALTILLMLLGTRRRWVIAVPTAFALLLAGDLALHNVNLRNSQQRPAVWQSPSNMYPAPPQTARVLAQHGVSIAGPRYAWLAPRVLRQHQLSRAFTALGQSLLVGGGNVRYQLPALSGYNPLIDREFTRAVRHSNGAAIPDRHFIYFTRAATPLLRAYSVRYYLCLPSTCPTGMRSVWVGGGVRLLEDSAALPYARLSTRSGGTTSLHALDATATTDTINLSLRAGQRSLAGTISVATRLDDGWRASVDGKTVPARAGRFGVMTVRAPAGWRSARFTYEAPGLRTGLILAAIGLLACAAAYATSRLRRPRRNEP